MEKFDGQYPEWPESLEEKLGLFVEELKPNDRHARLIGSKLGAAVEDRMWEGAEEPS